MSAESNPCQPFVFVAGFESSRYEGTLRSYVARKVWREKRVEQIRKYQNSSHPLPVAPVPSNRTSKKLTGKPAETQAEAVKRYKNGRQPRFVNAQLLPFPTRPVATDTTLEDSYYNSLLAATERELINTDPFQTLPCRLDRAGQDLAYSAKSLFLQYAPNWTSTLSTRTAGLRLAYTHKANFCSMLAGASKYLDILSGRKPSMQTLQWASATTSCVRLTLSNPSTQGGDEVLMGVFLLLANDVLVEDGKYSHIHSKALARLFRLRGGVESMQLPHTMELFVNFNLITFGKSQIAYLDHLKSDAEGAIEMQEWSADVDLLVLELRNLNTLDKVVNAEGQIERKNLLLKLIGFLQHPKDITEEHHWAFTVCYLAVMLWEYRYRFRDCKNLLEELIYQYEQLRPEPNIANVAWLLVQGVDHNGRRKWHVNRMIKVMHRLSKGLRVKIGRFLYGLVDPREAGDMLLDLADFENIYQEAFAGLPLTESAK